MYLKELHGIRAWSKEESKRASWYTRITSSKLKMISRKLSKKKTPEGLHEWTSWFRLNSSIKVSIQKVNAETGSLGCIQIYCLYAGMPLGEPVLNWCWMWQYSTQDIPTQGRKEEKKKKKKPFWTLCKYLPFLALFLKTDFWHPLPVREEWICVYLYVYLLQAS